MWEWNGDGWARLPDGPVAIGSPRLAYDTARERLVLYATDRAANGAILDETWGWDGFTWTPGAAMDVYHGANEVRARGSLAYDPVRQRTVYSGGGSSSFFATSNEWSGMNWVQRATDYQSAQIDGAAIYDPLNAGLVSFGGVRFSGASGGTYRLPSEPAPPRIVVHPAGATTRLGSTVNFFVGADGPGPFTYQWHVGGVHLEFARRWSASDEPVFTLTGLLQADRGASVMCTVSNSCGSVTTTRVPLVVLPCGIADFDNDTNFGTDQDIEAFFACLAGHCCDTCGTVDFNGDGDFGTDQDIEAFFRVLAGGNC